LILDGKYWRNHGVKTLKDRLALQPNTKKAKNVILFIGDGMGVATHTAARIYKGPMFSIKIDRLP
jgi:alkaline phosphatase